MLMIEFVSDDLGASGHVDPVYALFVNPQFLNQEAFEATVLSLVPVQDNQDLLAFAPGERHDLIPWFTVRTENQLLSELKTRSSSWQMYKLTTTVRAMDQRFIEERHMLHVADLEQRECEKQEKKSALQALRVLQRHSSVQKSSRKQKGKKKVVCDPVSDDSSSSEISSSSSGSSVAWYAEDEAMNRKKRGKRASSAAAVEALSAEGLPAEAEVVAVAPGAPRRPRTRLREVPLDWKPGIGCLIAYEEYMKRDGTMYLNYTIQCTRHDDCFKTMGRSLGNIKSHGGEIGVLAFLHAWLDVDPDPDKPDKTHRATNPHAVDVADFRRKHHEDLDSLFHLLTG